MNKNSRGYIPPSERVPLQVGAYVHGFAGWHKIASVEPLRAVCGMGFGGILPTVARLKVEQACPLCARAIPYEPPGEDDHDSR